jgi:hypothetical protein
MSFDKLPDFPDMQPLSRVKPDAITNWGQRETMTLRPNLAVKVAQCISHWSEIEVHLGAFLALLLHANEKAALAMYSGLENRSAQLRLITAAAEASLDGAHFDIISVLLSSVIRPAMKERDKLAHWIWGYSHELPEALLITEPHQTLTGLMEVLRRQRGRGSTDVPASFDKIYVVRDNDLDGIITRSRFAKDQLRIAMATIWEANSPEQHAEFRLQLSSAPQIREGLDRLGRQKTQATLQASPPPEQSE